MEEETLVQEKELNNLSPLSGVDMTTSIVQLCGEHLGSVVIGEKTSRDQMDVFNTTGSQGENQ